MLTSCSYAAKPLSPISPILHSGYVGAETRFLHAAILAGVEKSDEAIAILEDLLAEEPENPEIAGAAHSLLAKLLLDGTMQAIEYTAAANQQRVFEHLRKAEELLPETAEAYFLQALTALTVGQTSDLLGRALDLDPQHYEALRLRTFTNYASRRYEDMKEDARVMLVLRPNDSLGYSLRARALCELGKYDDAVQSYEKAIEHTPAEDPWYMELNAKRCEVLVRMGEYERVVRDARECLGLASDGAKLRFHVFCALVALGDYEEATASFDRIAAADSDIGPIFRDWAMRYVLDALDAGRPWHPSGREPEGYAFVSMLEAEETYRHLKGKARRVVRNGLNCDWSPDGTELAFSLGVPGYSGVAVFDLLSHETRLLIAPGKDPKWSPDGQYIAFVRDCPMLQLSELAALEHRNVPRSHTDEQVWIIRPDGTEPRRLDRGGWPSWDSDSELVYYQSRRDRKLYSISVVDPDAQPRFVMPCSSYHPSVSPDGLSVALVEDGSLKIKDIVNQSVITDWVGSPTMWSAVWSPTGRELSLGGVNGTDVQTGLWIYDLEGRQAKKVLSGQITTASWATDGTQLAFSLGAPFYEIWVADLYPGVSAIEALGPGQTLEQHCQEMLDLYSYRIAVNHRDADSYLRRAQHYKYLHLDQECSADMNAYVNILNLPNGTSPHAEWLRSLLVGLWQSAPANLGPLVNSRAHDCVGCISADGRSLFFNSTRPGGWGRNDLWVTTRETISAPWGAPANIGATVNAPSVDYPHYISADGLLLYLTSDRQGGYGQADIWRTTRTTADGEWSEPVNLGPPVNSPSWEENSSLSSDGCALYFTSDRPAGHGSHDIWFVTRATVSEGWGTPTNLGPPVNSPFAEILYWISADDLTLLFGSNRPGGYGGADLWLSTRATVADPWGAPVNLGPTVNSPYNDLLACISADGSAFYFSSDRPGGSGGWDLWQVQLKQVIELGDEEKD